MENKEKVKAYLVGKRIECQWTSRRRLLLYVFLNGSGNDRIKRFDKAWKKACKDAKIGLRLFHDFRRTTIRNLVR
jgi:integrase